MKLTQYQKKALGFKKVIPEFIWNDRMAKIYKPIDKRNTDISDGQTFPEFL